jgi:hypothetical protein
MRRRGPPNLLARRSRMRPAAGDCRWRSVHPAKGGQSRAPARAVRSAGVPRVSPRCTMSANDDVWPLEKTEGNKQIAMKKPTLVDGAYLEGVKHQ